MRLVTTRLAAAALGVAPKALDNLLVREAKFLVPPGKRGLARLIPLPSLELLAVALLLVRDAGIPRGKAVVLARSLVGSDRGEMALGTLGRLSYDLAALRRVVESAIADNWEEGSLRPRGRPPRKNGAGRPVSGRPARFR